MSCINVLSALPNDHFLCSLCADVFTDPVSAPCGHSFCRACLSRHWDRSDFCQCPTCHKRFPARPEICTNAVIQEISVQLKRRRLEAPDSDHQDALVQVQCDACVGTPFPAEKSCLICQASFCSVHLEPHRRAPGLLRHRLMEPVDNIEERVCPIHDRVLELYCRGDSVCVCALCVDAEHSGHCVVSLDEESAQRKESIEAQVVRVKTLIDDRMEKIKEFTDSSGLRSEKAQEQIQNMDAVVKTFSRHMQEAQADVRTSVEEKLRLQREREEAAAKELQDDVQGLRLKRWELEELLQIQDPLRLLQTLQILKSPSEAEDRTKTAVYSDIALETVRVAVSQLLDTFQSFLKILTEKEIARMKQYKEFLTFDPSTAGRRLAVYESDTRIKHHKYPTQSVTEGPQRFALPMVLCKPGFASGRHYWEVQVGLRSNWDVGVAKESVSRASDVLVSSDNGFYAIGKDGLAYEALCSRYTVLHVAPRPTHIGVYLDYDEGRVSFYDVGENKHIYSFTGETFTEKLYPFFYLYSKAKKSEPIGLRSLDDYVTLRDYLRDKKQNAENENGVSQSSMLPAESSQPEQASK